MKKLNTSIVENLQENSNNYFSELKKSNPKMKKKLDTSLDNIFKSIEGLKEVQKYMRKEKIFKDAYPELSDLVGMLDNIESSSVMSLLTLLNKNK